MRPIYLIATALVVSAPAVLHAADSQTRQPGPAAAPAPVVADTAEKLLRQMGQYIGSADQFTFHADILFDHVLPSGQKLQYAAAEDVALQRPGRLYVEWSGDLGDRQFWYDGKSATLYDPSTPFYASAQIAGDIDGLLQKAVTQLGFSPPLSDLLYQDPYGALHGAVQYGFDLGLNDVAGRSCHALAFVEKDIDWQINRTTNWNNYNSHWGGYYSGLGLGAGIAIGASVAALPLAAYSLAVAGAPYWYANGVYYAPQGATYVVTAPPVGAVVPTPSKPG